MDAPMEVLTSGGRRRRSEKSDPEQFELALEDLETAIAVVHAEEDTEDRLARRPAKPRSANRGSLPKHLLRIEEIIEPQSQGVRLIGELYAIEAEIRGLGPEQRLAARQERSDRLSPG